MKYLLWLLFVLTPMSVVAHEEEEDSEAAEAAPTVRYFTIKPTFVTNFGFSESGRLKFVKADVTLRLSSPEAEAALAHHLPYLRNNIVLLISKQDDHAVTSSDGREQLRKDALAEVRALMVQEEGEPLVDDLVFNNFVVQR